MKRCQCARIWCDECWADGVGPGNGITITVDPAAFVAEAKRRMEKK